MTTRFLRRDRWYHGSETGTSVFSGTGSLLDDTSLANEAQNTAAGLPTLFLAYVVHDAYRGQENPMSAPIAVRVMIVDDHHGWDPSAMEKTGHLANGQIPPLADDSRQRIPYTGVKREPRQLHQR